MKNKTFLIIGSLVLLLMLVLSLTNGKVATQQAQASGAAYIATQNMIKQQTQASDDNRRADYLCKCGDVGIRFDGTILHDAKVQMEVICDNDDTKGKPISCREL